MTPETVERLTNRQQDDVLGLVRDATRTDGVAPLSEQVLLSVRDGDPGTAPTPGSLHLLSYAGLHLTGYAHLDQSPAGPAAPDDAAATAEVVVDPSSRRRGEGTAMLHALDAALTPGPSPGRSLQLWSHGDLDAARAFALHHGCLRVRELWQMRRSLRSDAPGLPRVALTEGFSARHFVVGRDEDAWLRVNALAFVDHPEQGRMTRHDLDQRIAQDWFDPRGFILIEDTRGPAPVLAASHWTKVIAAEKPEGEPVPPAAGEVYVVGVDPAYQGQGLGRIVTVLGLAHLRDLGLGEAMLYVDADNQAAITTYSRLDFVRCAVDIMYSRTVLPPV